MATVELPPAQNPRWVPYCVTYICSFTHGHVGPSAKCTCAVWSHSMKASPSYGHGSVTPGTKLAATLCDLLYCFTCGHVGLSDKCTCKVWSHSMKPSPSYGHSSVTPGTKSWMVAAPCDQLCCFTQGHMGPWDKFAWQVWSHSMKPQTYCQGGNSTITKLHQNYFQDILETFEKLVELTQLNHGGRVTQPCQQECYT